MITLNKYSFILLSFLLANFIWAIEKQFVVIDRESQAPISGVAISIDDLDIPPAYTDDHGEASLLIDTDKSKVHVLFEVDCYKGHEETIRIRGTNKPVTIYLERFCFENNKVGVLICDFFGARGKVTDETARWAESLRRRLEDKMEKESTLRAILEVKRWTEDQTLVRHPAEAEKTGRQSGASMVIYSSEPMICEPGAYEYCLQAKILNDLPIAAKDLQQKGSYEGKVIKAELLELLGVDADTMLSFILGYTYLKDIVHKQYPNAVEYLMEASKKPLSNEADKRTIQFYLAQASRESGSVKGALGLFMQLEKSGGQDSLIRATCLHEIGVCYTLLGDWDRALEFYAKSEAIFTKTSDKTTLAITYSNIGSIYDKKGDWDRALEFYAKSKAISIAVGDKAALATTYNNIGLIYDKKGDWDRALEFYTNSEAIRKEIGDKAGLAPTYNNIGGIYTNKGDWDQALEFYTKSEAISKEVGDKAGLAITYNNIGLIYTNKGDWDQALEFFAKSEAIRKEVGDKAGLATIYNNIGGICNSKGDWDQALEFFAKSEVILKEIDDKAGLATTYNNIGLIYTNKGDWDRALESYVKSEAISKEVGDKVGLGYSALNIAVAYYEQGDSKAVDRIDAAVAIFAEIGAANEYKKASECQLDIYARFKEDPPEHSTPLQKAIFYQSKKNWEISTSLYQTVLSELHDRQKESELLNAEEKATVAEIQNLIGIGFIKQGKGEQALDYLKRSLTYYDARGEESKETVGTLYNNMGAAYKVAEKWQDAEEWLNKSLIHNREVVGDSAAVLGNTQGHLCEVYSALSNYNQALKACQASLTICQQHKLVERECETLAALTRVYDKLPDQEFDPILMERKQVLECE